MRNRISEALATMRAFLDSLPLVRRNPPPVPAERIARACGESRRGTKAEHFTCDGKCHFEVRVPQDKQEGWEWGRFCHAGRRANERPPVASCALCLAPNPKTPLQIAMENADRDYDDRNRYPADFGRDKNGGIIGDRYFEPRKAVKAIQYALDYASANGDPAGMAWLKRWHSGDLATRRELDAAMHQGEIL